MEKKLQKPYLTNENLLMAQDLWQAQCQTLLIILLKEFTKLNVNMNMIRKIMKHVDKDCECCVEYSNVKHDLIEYKCLCRNKNYQNKFDRNLWKGFATTYKDFYSHLNMQDLLTQVEQKEFAKILK